MAEQRANTVSNTAHRKIRYLLVVDSDTNNLYYISMLLQRLDYQICAVKTAAETLEMVMVAVPSLIIVDLHLEDMHGLELLRQIKHNPGTADIPFITLRRQGDLVGEKQSFELGAVDCLCQPVSAEQLFRAIQAVIEATPRTNIRIRTRLLVTVNNMPLDQFKGASISELSERGMFLRTRSPAAVNTRLSLRIGLNDQLIAAEAVVLYSDQTGKGPNREPGMGLEFVRIESKDQELIRQFVRNEVTRGITPVINR